MSASVRDSLTDPATGPIWSTHAICVLLGFPCFTFLVNGWSLLNTRALGLAVDSGSVQSVLATSTLTPVSAVLQFMHCWLS